MAARTTKATDDAHVGGPVTWRDGVHVTGTPIWCDAVRARGCCFLSHAHAVERPRHGQLIATAETLALLGDAATGSRLAVPYGRPFSLGDARLELIRSGHGLGGASLLVEVRGHRVLYCDAVCPRPSGLGGAAESRACHTLVVGAHYGDPRYRFGDPDDARAQVAAFVRETIDRGGAACLLVSSPKKALDVAAGLAGLELPRLSGHRAIFEAAARARAVGGAGAAVPRLVRSGRQVAAGQVLLWPLGRPLPGPLPPASRTALVSGLALDPARVAAAPIDAAFAWSDCADYNDLVQYIDACAPEQVFATRRFAEPLARALDRPGRRCRALGPARQIELF